MTPPPNHPCESCHLQEARGGRVCPRARDAYGLADLVAQHQAEALHAAILADAGRTPGFAELVRLEAQQPQTKLLAPSPRLLPAASAVSTAHNQQKETIRVAISRPIQ
jgi:hypothetical protein